VTGRVGPWLREQGPTRVRTATLHGSPRWYQDRRARIQGNRAAVPLAGVVCCKTVRSTLARQPRGVNRGAPATRWRCHDRERPRHRRCSPSSGNQMPKLEACSRR
jgi:hypothetical protein